MPEIAILVSIVKVDDYKNPRVPVDRPAEENSIRILEIIISDVFAMIEKVLRYSLGQKD